MLPAPSKKQIFWLKGVIIAIAMIPLIRLFILGWQDSLGANPIQFVEHSTGTWALVMLLITLSMTPIRLLTGLTWQIQLRGMFGLLMFFYVCLHFLAYIWLDFWFVWEDIAYDIGKHPFVLVGFSAFVLTIPLAFTSNNFMMRRLKGRWKTLHRLVYIIAILVIMHFWWLVKKDITEPFIYATVLAMLLGIRIYFNYKKILKKA
ncbi:sulfoxide reductase heme-binding subunit YedZ [Methylovorus sp. MM2]|uniref:sulfite oxidase heme-binding subunit YedZ n=1 Tax=Methylovorus sp. MM2 TaxID=1848038 RepID=UPI0007E020F7|nr:protein-methionine-sulfoxide reductase heme-binding subunit MsrQ [Methylovorus sp. MM2]OAM53029.1 sulfoxide reductase heme-binding subunit YedZ [Methylovorus sp. MM2]